MKTLPRTTDGLRGLRAATWVRGSTAGQYDNFGPDAQTAALVGFGFSRARGAGQASTPIADSLAEAA